MENKDKYELDPLLETVLEEQMIEGGVPESEIDPSINDIEESMDDKLKKSKHVNSMEYNPNEMIGRVIELRETPGFEEPGWEERQEDDIPTDDIPTILNGRYEIIEWDPGNAEFGLVTEEEGEINRTIPDDQPFVPTIYWVDSEYVNVPQEIVNEVEQLEQQYEMPTVQHPVEPNTPSVQDFDPNALIGQFTVLDEVPCEDLQTGQTEYVTGTFKVVQWDEANYGFVLQTNDDLQEQYWAPAEYVVPQEVAEPEVDMLDEQYGMPAVEHPLGPYEGSVEINRSTMPNEHLGFYGEEPYSESSSVSYRCSRCGSIFDGREVHEMDAYQGCPDCGGPLEVMLKHAMPNEEGTQITSAELLNKPFQTQGFGEEGPADQPYADAHEKFTDEEYASLSPEFQNDLRRVIKSLKECGVSQEDMQATILGLIHDYIRSGRSASEVNNQVRADIARIAEKLRGAGYDAKMIQDQIKRMIEEEQKIDSSLDRQQMPAEHLGFYHDADFQEKGTEENDGSLPNVHEEIVMPDVPTGLEKD